jgi:epoxyqueuosine reductase
MTTDSGGMIIEKAKEIGASLAGIASVEHIKKSPSHQIIKILGMEIDGVNPYQEIVAGFDEVKWPTYAKSALVIAVSHPQDKPELDWWVGFEGTLGNSELIRINRELSSWIEETLNIKTHQLSYYIEKGGIFLKDSAFFAGIGCVGKNNILVTPEYGPRVRLRAMLIEEEFAPTGPIDFNPCDDCEEFCRKACPQNAFENIVISSFETGVASLPGRSGCYSRSTCLMQLDKNDKDSGNEEDETINLGVDIENFGKTKHPIKSCRQCEFACPVGK